jgi:hypothetical protein
MRLAELVGGPLHGETVQITATVRDIDVDLGDGTFATYSRCAAGYWQYKGAKRAPATKVTQRRELPPGT